MQMNTRSQHRTQDKTVWLQDGCQSLHRVGAVVLATNDLELHSWQVLGSPTAKQHHIVLLQCMALSRNVGYHHTSIAQLNAAALSASRVGLLWGTDQGLEHNALHLRSTIEQAGTAWLAFNWSMPYYLVDGAQRNRSGVDIGGHNSSKLEALI